jgi:hypothetical protein
VSGASITGPGSRAMSQASRRPVVRGLSAWLALAAAPTFTAMALLTGFLGGAGMCSAAHAPPLSGMVPMYLLMATFHSPPWLRLIAGRSWVGAVRNRRR